MNAMIVNQIADATKRDERETIKTDHKWFET